MNVPTPARPAAHDGSLRDALRAWFLQPPRPHGEVLVDRTVSFLELFYDLVYVVVVARAAHHLAGHLSWAGVVDFAVVFGLIWLAWLNGTLLHELHGREDGRSRSWIFVQMLVLALLAVHTAEATGEAGQPFAVTYTVLLSVLAYQWATIRRHDPPELRGRSTPFLIGLSLATVVFAVSIFTAPDVRLLLWGAFLVVSLATGLVTIGRQAIQPDETVVAESLVERFGLFVIIVLGETVVGVVEGLSESVADARTLVTGALALVIGFGLWWNYFDATARQGPRQQRVAIGTWVYAHLPLTGGIAAAGAATVTLVEHAGDARVPAATGWVLGGALAITLVAIAAVLRTLERADGADVVYAPVAWTLVAGAAAALVVVAVRPAPWALVLALLVVLNATWGHAFLRHAAGRSLPGAR